MRFDLPTPPRSLHPNSRPHWARKSADAAEYKAAVRKIVDPLRPTSPMPCATIHLHYWTRTAACPDDDGLICWFKWGRDAIADAGFVTNDRRFILLPPTWSKDAKNPRVTVTIEPVTGR